MTSNCRETPPLRHPATPPLRPRNALTLIEVMFAIIIMSVMLVASFGAVSGAAKTRIAQQESAFGLALAKQLMAEIIQTRYQDLANPVFGPEGSETRATFNDVDDYENYKENSGPIYADGTPIPGSTGWKRSTKVDWVSPTDPNTKINNDQGLKRIVVTVTSPSGKPTSLTAFRSNYDRYEQIPGSQLTYTCWAGVSIQIGSSSSGRNIQGTNLVNMTP